jgi:hypothetical protein
VSRANDLVRQQRWLQAAIVTPMIEPAIVEAGDAATMATIESVEDVVTASATQSAAERLAIYQRSYQARLLECLRAVFPALRHALGHALFERFATDYLVHHPPASYTLARLAAGFPAYLAATRPDAARPAAERAPWADFLIELATLEFVFQEVYDGEGLETAVRPAVDEVVALPPGALLATRFVPAPSLRLFELGFATHAYLTVVRRGEEPPLPAPHPTPLAVTRHQWRVRFHPLFKQQYALLAALDGSRTLGEAIAAAAFPAWDPVDPAVLRAWLRGWLEASFFARVDRTT